MCVAISVPNCFAENESDEVKTEELHRRMKNADVVMEKRQRIRVVQCAVNLAAMLEDFVNEEDGGAYALPLF